MGKRKELTEVKSVVEYCLRFIPATRNSDWRMMYEVYRILGKKIGIDVDTMSMKEFFLEHDGLPSTESIRRTRQKLQAENEEYKANIDVKAFRDKNEDVFFEVFGG